MNPTYTRNVKLLMNDMPDKVIVWKECQKYKGKGTVELYENFSHNYPEGRQTGKSVYRRTYWYWDDTNCPYGYHGEDYAFRLKEQESVNSKNTVELIIIEDALYLGKWWKDTEFKVEDYLKENKCPN